MTHNRKKTRHFTNTFFIKSRRAVKTSITTLLAAIVLSMVTGTVDRVWAENSSISITVAAAYWPPYIYREMGTIKGHTYEIAKAVLDRAGVKATFTFEPWARVYQRGLKQENYMICALGRTPKRENLFQWIGPVTKQSDIYFFKLKRSRASVSTLEDIKKFTTLVERDTYNHDFLESKGFTHGKNYHAMADPSVFYKMLLRKRADFMLISERLYHEGLVKRGYDTKLCEKSLFAFSTAEYMALSKSTPAELATRIRRAYLELESEGKIQLR